MDKKLKELQKQIKLDLGRNVDVVVDEKFSDVEQIVPISKIEKIDLKKHESLLNLCRRVLKLQKLDDMYKKILEKDKITLTQIFLMTNKRQRHIILKALITFITTNPQPHQIHTIYINQDLYKKHQDKTVNQILQLFNKKTKQPYALMLPAWFHFAKLIQNPPKKSTCK